jgi:hypothetical protein
MDVMQGPESKKFELTLQLRSPRPELARGAIGNREFRRLAGAAVHGKLGNFQ